MFNGYPWPVLLVPYKLGPMILRHYEIMHLKILVPEGTLHDHCGRLWECNLQVWINPRLPLILKKVIYLNIANGGHIQVAGQTLS